MKKFLAVVLLLTAPVILMAQDSVQEWLDKGNAAYDSFDNATALTCYKKVLELDEHNFEGLWKTARALTDVGKALGGDAEKEHYLEADKYARKCIELYADKAESHYVLALAVGRLALFEGGKRKIELSKEVEAEAKKALELNPQHDGAAHILGRWNYNIATLGWFLRAAAKVVYGGVPQGATLENAAKYFSMAIELNPEKPVHRLEYARTLIELGNYTEAKTQLQKCLDLEKVQWEDDNHKKEAAEMLKEIRNK
ncbi:tetratricopeptide repeat protein [candidate division KSB1 bacterium]|nr:tetratricopeptide repeat protein [candidate division KSB1 bacterium]